MKLYRPVVNLCVRAALALSILLFVPGLSEGFENPKAAAVRVCGLAALAMAAASWRRLRTLAWTPLDAAVGAWLATELLATLFSSAPVLSLFGEPIQREGFTTSLAAAGIYLAARVGVRDPADAMRTLDVAIGAAAVASALALLEAAGVHVLHGVPRMVGGAPLAADRPGATLGYPTLLAVVSAPGAVAGWLLAGAPGRARALRLLGAALCTGGTLCTLSRAGILALAAGSIAGLATLALARRGRWITRRALVTAVATLALLAVATLATGLGARLVTRFAELLHPGEGSSGSRVEIWRSALTAWRERPWLGWGPDSFASVFRRFQTAGYWRYEWSTVPFHAHSIYLQALATRGVIGLLAGAAWCGGLVAALATAWRAPAARSMVAAAVGVLAALAAAGGFGALGIAGQTVLVATSGLLAALGSSTGSAALPRSATRAAWVVAALALGWGAADLASSAAEVRFTYWLNRIGDPREPATSAAAGRAIESAAAAARWAPFEDRGAGLHATALLAAADVLPRPRARLTEATVEARQAVARVPQRSANHLLLGRVLATRVAMGDFASSEEARLELARAARMAPMDAIFLGECARMELIMGDPGPALEMARSAVTVYPGDGASRAMLARALAQAGDREAAARELARALAGEWHGDRVARDEAAADLRRLARQRP